MTWRGDLAGHRCLVLGLLVCLRGGFQPAETLELEMGGPVMALLGKDVLLTCNILGYNPPELDIKKMAVTWYLSNGTGKKKLYSVFSGNHISYRSGSRLDESELKKGNAALFLSHIQLNEGGTYICSVTVTPDKADGITALHIVAQPTINLSPTELTLEKDKEKTLSCTVNEFYPEFITISWQKNSKHTQVTSVPVVDICTGSSVKNGDGTFNVTSKLRLQPSSQDDGNIYSCIVEHKSFPMKRVFNATLTVTEPKQDLSWVAGLIFGIIAACVLIVVVYYKFFKKISPKHLTFFGNEELKHLEETQLLFFFNGFRPKPLRITFYLITQPSNEKQIMYSWDAITGDNLEKGAESLPLLKRLKNVKFESELKDAKTERTFDVTCKIYIVPDAKKLSELKLALEVQHQALPHGLFTEEKSFRVISLPLLDQIQCSTDVPISDEPVTLTCRIHSYFPEALDIRWTKEDEPILEGLFVTDSMKNPDGLFSCNSSIKFLPKAIDIRKRFICKANLKNSQQGRASAWEMKTLVFTPQLSEIECEPSVPEVGKLITLSCSMKNFNPPACNIYWRKGFQPPTLPATTKKPQLDPTSNLYYTKSQVSVTPSAEDHAAEFIVEINHCDRTISKRYQLMLRGFPSVANIVLNPSDAEYGKALSLTCEVSGIEIQDAHTQWLSGDTVISDGPVTEDRKKGPNDYLTLSSKFQLVPTALDYDKMIRFKVKHGKLKNPIIKSVFLKLPAKPPVMSTIKATPEKFQPGQSISLEVSITNFAPRDIRVLWFKNWKPLSEDNPIDIQIGENKLCYFTSKILFNLREKDLGKTIRCEVFHATIIQEKSFVLKSRDVCDSTEQISSSTVNLNHVGALRTFRPISEEAAHPVKIECVTSSPKAGKKVTLRCFVYGKRADGANVSWFKGLYPVNEEIKNTDCDDRSGFVSHVTVETEKEERECEIRCEVEADEGILEDTYLLKL